MMRQLRYLIGETLIGWGIRLAYPAMSNATLTLYDRAMRQHYQDLTAKKQEQPK